MFITNDLSMTKHNRPLNRRQLEIVANGFQILL